MSLILEINYRKSLDENRDLKESIDRLSMEKVDEIVNSRISDIKSKNKLINDQLNHENNILKNKLMEKSLEDYSRFNLEQSKRLEDLINENTKIKYINDNNKNQLNELSNELKQAKDKLLIQENSSKKGKLTELNWEQRFLNDPDFRDVNISSGQNYSADFIIINNQGHKILLDSKHNSPGSGHKVLEKGEKGINKMIRDMRHIKNMDLGILFATYDIQGCEKVLNHKILPVKISEEKTVNLILLPNIRHEREYDYMILKHFINCSDLYIYKTDTKTDYKYAIQKTVGVLQSSINQRKRIIESSEKELNNEVLALDELKLFNINEKEEEYNWINDFNKKYKISNDSIICIEDYVKNIDNKTKEIMKSHFKDNLILKSDDLNHRKKYKELSGISKLPVKDKLLWLLKGYQLIN